MTGANVVDRSTPPEGLRHCGLRTRFIEDFIAASDMPIQVMIREAGLDTRVVPELRQFVGGSRVTCGFSRVHLGAPC